MQTIRFKGFLNTEKYCEVQLSDAPLLGVASRYVERGTWHDAAAVETGRAPSLHRRWRFINNGGTCCYKL
jgi:hypothetical protein